MKRIISAIALLMLCATTFAQGDGETNTKTGIVLANEHKIVVEARRSAMNFDKIEVTGAIRVIVEERTKGNIIVRAPQSVMPYVSLKVKDGTLYASLLRGTPLPRKSDIIAVVYIPNNKRVTEIEAESAAQVVVNPTIRCNNLELSAKKAAVIKCKVEAKEVEMELGGASTIDIGGGATEGEVSVGGGSTLRAGKLNISSFDVECFGSSKATVKANNCKAEAWGSSTIIAECSRLLKASAKGASIIRYSGDCKVISVAKSKTSIIDKK